jgi:hypothetical protein
LVTGTEEKRMSPLRKSWLLCGAFLLLVLQFVPVLVAGSWIYMTLTLEAARRGGVYATPEEGMRILTEKSWIDVRRLEIERVGPNSRDGSQPHVWLVTAKVWAASRGDGQPVSARGYDLAGSFFLHAQDGWVHVPEGRLPWLVGWMMTLCGCQG